jgi:hypothetical protein
MKNQMPAPARQNSTNISAQTPGLILFVAEAGYSSESVATFGFIDKELAPRTIVPTVWDATKPYVCLTT